MTILLLTLYLGLKEDIKPPVADTIPKADTLFNDVRIDNYYWLRDKDNPAVISYLKAENDYAKRMMKHTEKFQEQLYEEMRRRIKETDLSVPERIGDYYYYTRTEAGKQYPINCRKKRNLNAIEEIIIDQNALAGSHTYFEVGVVKPSPNHELVAYTVDTSGAELYTLCIKDLVGDSLYHERIADIEYRIEWANDNRTIFYVTSDRTYRPYRLYRHRLGAASPDENIYQEDDAMFYMDISKTRSNKYFLLLLDSKTTTEVLMLEADNPNGQLKIISPRKSSVEYYVDHSGDYFYIMTNENAMNFKIMKTPTTNLAKDNWQEVIPARDSVLIEGMDSFKDYLVVSERENALPKLHMIELSTAEEHYVQFSEPVYAFWANRNPEFNTNIFRFTYTSFITPRSVFDYNMQTRENELKKQDEVRGYQKNLYKSERILAKAGDGTLVPIALVYKKGLEKNGHNPLLLDGYGAYGSISDPYFSSNQLSLLDRGFIYAVAQVRGGGEMGRYWYEQGKLLNKKNTFTDFIACAEYLIKLGYTSQDYLVIEGGSTGGLLIGAVLNIAPSIFKGAIAYVPFVDALNTMLDDSIPLTVTEYEDWGNPNIEEYYFYIKSYAPYENVARRKYPRILITAGLNDPRVGYWEPAKWAAKLRALKTDDNMLLLKTNMGAGHGGFSGRYERLKDTAFEYAFILSLFGIKD